MGVGRQHVSRVLGDSLERGLLNQLKWWLRSADKDALDGWCTIGQLAQPQVCTDLARSPQERDCTFGRETSAKNAFIWRTKRAMVASSMPRVPVIPFPCPATTK